MNKYKYFIGIDISKNKLDICVSESKKVILESCIDNTPKALAAFGKKIKKMSVLPKNGLLCCEYTGNYANNLIGWSTQYGYKIWVERPIQIKKSIGMQRGKNDKIDAYRIGMYAFRYQDEAVIFEIPRKEVEELKHLLADRQRLLKTRKQLKVPLKELQGTIDGQIYKSIAQCSKNTLMEVENDLKKVDERIQQIIKQDEELTQLMDSATSVTGVGDITAISLIVATNEFKAIKSGKQMACYAGLVPFAHQSGSSIRGRERVSHFANKPLKSLLHLCAVSAKNHSEEFRQYYDRKIAEGKHVMSVLNAIRNKIMIRIAACVLGRRIYEKNFTNYLEKS